MGSGEKIICLLCNDEVEKLIYRFHLDSERVVIDKIKSEHPQWTINDGLCSRCLDYYLVEIVREQRILPAIGPHFPVKSVDDFVVLPTALRLDADPRYTGKGITICFLDSDFYPHPDLIATRNRIKKMVDVTSVDLTRRTSAKTMGGDWHGTMTSVVCAGDGYAGKGLYRGIASDAELVLIKTQNADGKITTKNILNALKWVLDNHEEFNIRIVNISMADDETCSYKESEVDQLAEQLIAKGIVVVAAVGNEESAQIHPPSNSLNVIAIGGIDDSNLVATRINYPYHSSFGKTIDGLMKPELVAHAIWIAAPILPGTFEKKEAEILYSLLAADDRQLQDGLQKNISRTKLPGFILDEPDETIRRELLRKRIQSAKYISPDYMHVDGTSFAAPIVSSVIAQLLEANDLLTPRHIRHLLFGTARRIPGIDPVRQGFGIVQPRKALYKVLKQETEMIIPKSPYVNREKKVIEFVIQNDCATQISLSGSFNNWAKDVLILEPGNNGFWKIEIPMLQEGKYSYKFCVDENTWMEDVDNPYREPDGHSGFNSILTVC